MKKWLALYCLSLTVQANEVVIFGRHHSDSKSRQIVSQKLAKLVTEEGLDCIAHELPDKLYGPAFEKTPLESTRSFYWYFSRLYRNVNFPSYHPLKRMSKKDFSRMIFGADDYLLYKRHGVRILAVDRDMEKSYHLNRPNSARSYNAAYEVENTMAKRNDHMAFNLTRLFYKQECKKLALVVGYSHLTEKSFIEKTQIVARSIQLILQEQYKVPTKTIVTYPKSSTKIPWESHYRLDNSGAIFFQSKKFVDEIIFY